MNNSFNPTVQSFQKPTVFQQAGTGPNSLGLGVQQGQKTAWAYNNPNDQGMFGNNITGNGNGFGSNFTYAVNGQQQSPNGNGSGFGNPYGGNPYGLANSNFSMQGGGGGNGAFSLQGLLDQQKQSNDQARSQQQAIWDKLSGQANAIPGAYANSAITKGTQGLTQRFLQNPEALNDQTVQMMKNRANVNIRSQGDDALRQQQGILSAQGENDAGSIAAAAQRQALQNMMATTNSNTGIDIQRANQRNQDYMNALGQGRAQSMQDASIPLQVSQSLLGAMPQYRPDDYSGLGGLALAQSNQQGLLAALQGGFNQPNYTDPGSTAYSKVGPLDKYGNDPGFQGQMGGLINQYQQPPKSQQNQGGWFW